MSDRFVISKHEYKRVAMECWWSGRVPVGGVGKRDSTM